jgi:hypothetical protein
MKLVELKPKQQTIRTVLFIAVLFFALTAKAQVTIGSGLPPHDDALLDMNETGTASTKGMLMPRVALSSTDLSTPLISHVEGMTVYNTANTGDVTPGFYYNDGIKWSRLVAKSELAPVIFYMPSILLPTDTSDPTYYDSGTETFTVDLYGAYAEQFNLTDATSSTHDSTSSATIPAYPNSALDYYITYYDKDVFTAVTVSDTGILNYKLQSGFAITEKTYMNIVLKVTQ